MSIFSYHSQPEQQILIDIPDSKGLKVKAILRGDYSQPLVVIVHGRPGYGNHLLYFLFAHFLSEHGIASLRISLYDVLKTSRDQIDTRLETNASDLSVVAKYLRKQGVSKLFACGHSYGGLTILKSDAVFDAVVLWDPTHGLVEKRRLSDADYMTEYVSRDYNDISVITSGMGFVNSVAALKADADRGDTSDLAKGKGYPLKVISAGKGIMADLGGRYIEAADEPKQHVTIADAHHQFEDSDEIINELFEASYDWFNRYC